MNKGEYEKVFEKIDKYIFSRKDRLGGKYERRNMGSSRKSI